MRVEVNGVKLWFDVEGAGLVPEGAVLRKKPTLLLLHGGPGADHSLYKPFFSQFSDIAQVIYLDQRGSGRSEDGPPERWTLAQWGDDVRAFCDALGIERPIVYGASWGGVVAQSYAVRHPEHPRALIFAATCAKTDFEEIYRAFGRIGGAEAQAVARAYWSAPTPEQRQAYIETCVPLYSVSAPPAEMFQRDAVAMAYNGPGNEQGRFDFRAALGGVRVPLLLLSGGRDVIMPPVFSDQIERVYGGPVTRVHLDGAGHMQELDAPEPVIAALRRFVIGKAKA